MENLDFLNKVGVVLGEILFLSEFNNIWSGSMVFRISKAKYY